MRTNSILQNASLILVALCAWVIGMKTLLEPDMWWYMRTGEWILANGQVPTEDVFSFTFLGVEWINVKWLYEVIVHLFSGIGGPEFTSIFQSLVGVGIVLTSYGIYRQLSTNNGSKNSSNGIWAILTLLVLLVCSYRMTARPETISHWFSLLVIWIFLKSRSKSKFIYAWIPLQTLWTNLHEAYATGLVLMSCLVAFEYLRLRKSGLKLKQFLPLFALAGSVLGVMVNPRGSYMLLHPLEIFRQLGDNKFTTELYAYDTVIYWEQWQSYAFVALIGLVLLLLIFRKGKNIRSSITTLGTEPGWGYLIILVLVAYLGFSAQRNIPFFIFLAAPLLATWLSAILPQKMIPVTNWIALPLAMLVYFGIVSNRFYEISGSGHRYGLQVDPGANPIGLAKALSNMDYLQPHFSDYLSSSYLLWAIKDYQSFIDLRDLDVFPESFFKDVLVVSQNYDAFLQLEQLNEFKYCYLKRVDFPDLTRNIHQDSTWSLVFADPIASLFVKQADSKHQDIFEDFSMLETSGIANGINFLFNPMYHAYSPDVNIDFMAATYYSTVLDHELAIQRLNQIQKEDELYYESLCLKAQEIDALALTTNNDSLGDLAWNTLIEAKKLFPKRGKAYFQTGMMLFNRQREPEAATEFRISVKHDPENIDAWKVLANCQNVLMAADPDNSQKYVDKWFEYMENAFKLNPDDALMAYQLGVSYCERSNCEKAAPFLKNLGPLPYLSDEDNKSLMLCKRKCVGRD